MLKALIFDCDGVLVDTERHGHLVAFNRVFEEYGYNIEWNNKIYIKLLEVTGGKERIRYYFDTYGWPSGTVDKENLIKELHKRKTEIFMNIVESGNLIVRPGILRLIDEAIVNAIDVAVCSTANEDAVNLIVDVYLGSERKSKLAFILAGDMVSRKKPDPEIYLLAAKRLGHEPHECCMFEDSNNGLVAAKSAGMNCVVTWSEFSKNDDFSLADITVDGLGDSPNIKINLDTIKKLLQ